MWEYEISGKQVLTQWFSDRKRNRERPIIGDRRPPSLLGDIQPESWLAEYTTELLNVLNVLTLLVQQDPAHGIPMVQGVRSGIALPRRHVNVTRALDRPHVIKLQSSRLLTKLITCGATMARTLPGRLVDLSHSLLPGKEEYHLDLETHFTDELYPQYKRSSDTWYILQDISMSSHCGTHIEFPYHHKKDGMDAGSFPLERLVGDCTLLDFRHKEPGSTVSREEMTAAAGPVQRGDMLLLNFRPRLSGAI